MDVKRKSNFEWLRILAMGMIITLHYMIKGEMIGSPANDMGAQNLILCFITFACLCAVNVYVLISGYFLVETEFKFSRLMGLVVQVLEYSLLITVIMLVTGQVSLSELTLYDWIGYVFPIGTEEYWFITAYIVMYLLSPVLAAGVKAMTEKQLRLIILSLLFLVTLEKTLLPMDLTTDNGGYGFGWFIVLFLIAAYIRLYGISFLEGHTGRAWAVYGISVAADWAVCVFGSVLGVSTGMETFTHYSTVSWDYNFLFVLTAAVGLFYVFRNASFKEEAPAADAARKLGRLTLGVYLLHEHILVRYRWHSWLKVSPRYSFGFVLLNWLVSVIIVYAVGLLAEYLRQLIHSAIAKKTKHTAG